MVSYSKRHSGTQAKQNFSLYTLYKDIREDLDSVEETLKLFSRSSNIIISEISSYLIRNSGKRIRPALLLLCSKLLGYKGKENILMSAIIETIHTASLIHDDIIDNSKIRRGKETIHARWGANITVLLGDYLYIKAMGLSLGSTHKQIIQILTDTSAQMIEGELNEYYLSGNLDVEEESYLDIINKKTASLFLASCRIGAILANSSKKEEQDLAEFGTNLGMSFQIIDDLLDFTGDEKILGKPVLSDLNEGRVTLPLIYTLKNDNYKDRKLITSFLKEKNGSKKYKEEISEIIQSNGALQYTQSTAREFSSKSKEIIQQFPKSIYRDTLTLFPDLILTRNK